MSVLLVFDKLAVPPLPGQTKIFSTSGDLDSFQQSACSRPPPPITSTLRAMAIRAERVKII
jgi:hypothetical protein